MRSRSGREVSLQDKDGTLLWSYKGIFGKPKSRNEPATTLSMRGGKGERLCRGLRLRTRLHETLRVRATPAPAMYTRSVGVYVNTRQLFF